MVLEAKNRLHATRVDRIEVVDKPAVPDAEVLVFKRRKEGSVKTDLEKKVRKTDDNNPEGDKVLNKAIPTVNFNAEFMIKATESAVEVLQDGFFFPFFSGSEFNEAELKQYWNELFKDFQEVTVDILKRIAKKVKQLDDDKLTTEEVVDTFNRGLKIVTLSEAFSHLRNTLRSLMFSQGFVESPDEALVKIIEDFMSFVIPTGSELIEKKKTDPQEFEKVGRKISSARLKALQKAVEVLTSIINEQGEVSNKNKEAEDMDLEQISKQLEELSAKVDGVSGGVDLVKSALKDAGIPVTEAEKKAHAEALEKDKNEAVEAEKKKSQEAETAEKKAQEEAVEAEKADLEKRRVALALPEGSDKEAIEKAEKEIADNAEKFQKELPSKIEAIDKALASVAKFIETVGKRFGIKTSMDVDTTDKGVKGDPFAEALKG
jgi:predicted PP-loop superfamily ATPase